MIDDAALRQEFAAESDEHLDAIERLLTAGATDRPAVDRLFRAFHSLKGMSDALGARGMKTVAHRAEDLLGLARNGRVAVAGAVADALLAAVDVLRRQRGALLEAQQDEAAPAGLLDDLSALAAGTDVASAAEPPAAPGAARQLDAFAARAAAAAPLLLQAGADAAREATGLAAMAAEHGLDRLAAELGALAAGGSSPPALGRLRRLLLLLEAEAGRPAGAAALLAPAATEPTTLGPRLVAVAALVEVALGGADAVPLAAAAAEAADVAAGFGLDALERTLWQLADLAGRGGDPDAAALLATQGPLLAERLRGAAEAGGASLRDNAEPLPAEATDARIPAAFAALLGAEGRDRTLAALADGRALYRLRMATGLGAALEAAVAEVLTSEAELLTSRTLLDLSPPQLDMLVAGPTDLTALRRALDAADPAHRAVVELAAIDAAPPEAPRSAPVTLRVRQDTVDLIIALEAEVRAAALAVADAIEQGGGAEAAATMDRLLRHLPAGAGRELGAALGRLRAMQAGLERAEGRLSAGMRRLDDAVMEMRVVQVGTLLARLPRLVRALAQASGKQVGLVVDGEDVAIDRSLVELLADPLLHLVRNAVDHGIEPPDARLAAGKPARATLRISAARQTGQVRVQVSDDGRGIARDHVLAIAIARGLVEPGSATRLSEAEVFALLFRPGFSTAEQVTETSGRGVGLDVVQDAVRRSGGTLDVASTPGRGTTFTLRLPLTAAMQAVLIVESGGHPYALPAGRVDAVLDAGTPAPCDVVDLAAILARQGEAPGAAPRRPAGAGPTVLMKAAGRPFGLMVDRVQRRTDLLLRPVHPALAALPAVGGVGVLGNGEPVLVLEPDGLIP